MEKYLIKLVLKVVALMATVFGIYFGYESSSEILKPLLKWVMPGIPLIFACVFIKQAANLATSLVKSLLGVAPNSVSKILEAAIYILENNHSFIEKMIIKHAINIVVMQKNFLKKDRKKTEQSKNAIETVTELFLAKSKAENLRAKFIAVIGLAVLTIMSLIFSQSLLVCIIPVAFFMLLEVKVRVLEFRVVNGFFGTNRLEALQLLQFITDKKNKDDFDDKNGKRKVFVDLLKAEQSKVFNPENGVLQ